MFPGEPPVIHLPILVFLKWIDRSKDGNSFLPHWGYTKQMKNGSIAGCPRSGFRNWKE